MELSIQTIIVFFVAGLTLLVFKYFSGVNHNTVVGAVKEKKDLIIKIVVVIVVCSVALFLTNTQIKKVGKNTYINNFEQFVLKVQENHKDYSEEDWTKIEEEYQELSENQRQRYEKLFTKEDKKRISGLEGGYLSYRAGGFMDNVIETTKDAFNNAAEYVNGFMKGLNNKLLKDTIDE
tara:strand:+ start:2145 stop:2678 length:534 start_codon:yes stop_codon:yes gene_type:complete